MISFCGVNSEKPVESMSLDEGSTASSTSTTTINQFQTLSEYGYVLEELDGTYCISLPSYQVEPFQCFEDELEAIKNLDFRINLEEYRQGWIVKLLSYPLLTDEEYKITTDYYESILPGSIVNLKIEGKDYSCEDKDSGTVIDRFANEIHPLNLYEEGEEAASNLGYLVDLDYNCSQLIDGSGFSLYGPLFYQDNQWWGFQESNDDYWRNYGKDIEILAFMTRFAERISLASTNAFTPETTNTQVPETTTTTIASGVNIEPRIEILCEPETREDEFLGFKFTIYTGSSELEVLNIVSWLDSSRADDLFIYDDLPAPNETKERMYWVDDSFTQYEIEVLLMDKNDNFATNYCLWSKQTS